MKSFICRRFLKKEYIVWTMDILIGNVSLDNFLIFIFIFILTLVAGNASYALIRRLLDGRLPLRNSKLIAKVMEYFKINTISLNKI